MGTPPDPRVRALTERLCREWPVSGQSATFRLLCEQALQEGLEQGRREALTAVTREIVASLGSQCFGSPSATERQALEEIADLDQLEQLARRVLKAKSWSDLLELPAPAAPRPRRKRS